MAINRAQLQANLFQVLANRQLNQGRGLAPVGVPGVPSMGPPIDPSVMAAVEQQQAINAQPYGGPITQAVGNIAVGSPDPLDPITRSMKNLAVQHLFRNPIGPPGTRPLTPQARPPFIRPGVGVTGGY